MPRGGISRRVIPGAGTRRGSFVEGDIIPDIVETAPVPRGGGVENALPGVTPPGGGASVGELVPPAAARRQRMLRRRQDFLNQPGQMETYTEGEPVEAAPPANWLDYLMARSPRRRFRQFLEERGY